MSPIGATSFAAAQHYLPVNLTAYSKSCFHQERASPCSQAAAQRPVRSGRQALLGISDGGRWEPGIIRREKEAQAGRAQPADGTQCAMNDEISAAKAVRSPGRSKPSGAARNGSLGADSSSPDATRLAHGSISPSAADAKASAVCKLEEGEADSRRARPARAFAASRSFLRWCHACNRRLRYGSSHLPVSIRV
eukprot:1845735-Pleurochrysis_carterae.AAC.2